MHRGGGARIISVAWGASKRLLFRPNPDQAQGQESGIVGKKSQNIGQVECEAMPKNAYAELIE